MKKVKSAFQIRDTKIIYISKTFESDIQELKKNKDAWGEVVFEIVDKVAYFQHQYLHGYLLPDITFSLGEIDTEYVKQFILKARFLQKPVDDWKKIPKKYMSKCRVIVEGDKVIAYIPSTTDLKFDEMKQFLVECENFLIHGLNGHVGMSKDSNQAEAMQYRDLAEMPDSFIEQDLFID